MTASPTGGPVLRHRLGGRDDLSRLARRHTEGQKGQTALSHPRIPSPERTEPLLHELQRAFDTAVILTERVEVLGPDWESERRWLIGLKKRLGIRIIHHSQFHEEGTAIDGDATRS